MNEFLAGAKIAFQQKILGSILDNIIFSDLPIINWLILEILGLPIMYKIIKSIKYNFYIYKTYRIPSSIKLFLFDCIVIIVIFLVLIYLTIYKSYGWLIYPCIITISSMFIVIYFSFKSNSNNKNKYIKIKKIKPKKQQKPNKQKYVQKLNFKKYKLINKNRVKDKNNNEDKK